MTSSNYLPPACRDLIHALNQRYRDQFDRAERLHAELADIQASRAWRLFQWLRRLRRRAWGFGPSPAATATGLRVRGDLSTFPSPPWGQGPGVGGSALPITAKVSILIPFKDQLGLLRNCLRSLRRSTHRRLEIVLLDNGSTTPLMVRYLDHMQKRRGFRVIACPGPFNFARLCNTGARHANGDYLLFLNNDIEVQTPEWLERMLEIAGHSRIGVVGAALLYPDDTIQHAGIEPTPQGTWQHVQRGLKVSALGAGARPVSAVTGACLMIRRDRFQELDGFDERYPITHNDVDLCLRARERGWLTVVTPQARLVHFESLSRGYSLESTAADEE